MSHTVRPSPGPSRASTRARTSAFVIIASRCSNASSGSAHPAGAPRCPATQPGPPVLSGPVPSGAIPSGAIPSRATAGSSATSTFGSASPTAGPPPGPQASSATRSSAVPSRSAA